MPHDGLSIDSLLKKPPRNSIWGDNNNHKHDNNEEARSRSCREENENESVSVSNLKSVLRGGAAALRYEAFIRRGHSHNDYHQPYPLSSALRYGLSSVEVDVFPRNDGLWVAHTIFELDPSRTIDKLYIEPIVQILKKSNDSEVRNSSKSTTHAGRKSSISFPFSRISKRTRSHKDATLLKRRRLGRSSTNSHGPNGHGDNVVSNINRNKSRRLIYPENDALNLLVDFKGDAEKSMELLCKALKPLRPYLSKVDKKGTFHQGKVTVLISGNRPKDDSLLSKYTCEKGERFLFLDGRMNDIHSNSDTTLVPLVSVPWRRMHLPRVVGRREHYMRQFAEKAHKQGKIVRIWGAPNCEHLWKLMMETNIDLLSIDDHAKFARFASGTNH